MTPICHSKITSAFGAFRNVIVEFPIPCNVTELSIGLVCHALPENTATISARNGLNMLGAAIYDEIIIYKIFVHNHKIGKWDKYHIKNIAYLKKIKKNENNSKFMKTEFLLYFIKILINFVVTSQDKRASSWPTK